MISITLLAHLKIEKMYTVYHNPRCKKSRAGLEYVKSKTSDVEVIEYLKDPFTEEELKKLLMKLNKKPVDMIRTQEAIYRSDFKGRNFTDDEWIKIMIENPKLIKRPIVVKNNKAVWGDPVEEINVLF
jgi:arsenate reductase (glutaredoxin)